VIRLTVHNNSDAAPKIDSTSEIINNEIGHENVGLHQAVMKAIAGKPRGRTTSTTPNTSAKPFQLSASSGRQTTSRCSIEHPGIPGRSSLVPSRGRLGVMVAGLSRHAKIAHNEATLSLFPVP